jgi:hypothetical protein
MSTDACPMNAMVRSRLDQVAGRGVTGLGGGAWNVPLQDARSVPTMTV